jgi:hypothetical protein
MRLFIQLVLGASASFRGASQALGLFLSYVPRVRADAVPSWVCGRLWVLRLGYYKLTRAKELADDWVWLVDHSIQLGSRKCLVIVGIRLTRLPVPLRSLRYEDMEPIALVPMSTSNGDLVYRQLEATIPKTGVPRQIVADEGADLKKGIRLFCQTHAETVRTYDIKHKTASVLKQVLAQDEKWQEFKRQVAHTRQKVQQTSVAFISPRNHRTKSRYMNADMLIEWGLKVLHVLAKCEARQARLVDPASQQARSGEEETLLAQVGWVSMFRDQLHEWGEMLSILSMTEHVVRTEGLYRGVVDKLQACFRETGQTSRTQQVRAACVEFVAEASSHATPGETLVGSSEVLESLFGKLKHLEGEQAHNGFTGLVLSLPAMVASTTEEIIHTAMETVSTKNVLDWCQQYIGKSLQAKRKEVFIGQGKREQKWDQLLDTG